MHADIREAKLRQAAINRTAEMSSAQTTTDSYAQISETVIDAERANEVRYVAEEDGTNAVDVRIVGRIKDDAGNWSPWQAAAGSNASSSGLSNTSTALFPDDVVYDQYALEIKANVGGSQGNVTAYGKAFFLDK